MKLRSSNRNDDGYFSLNSSFLSCLSLNQLFVKKIVVKTVVFCCFIYASRFYMRGRDTKLDYMKSICHYSSYSTCMSTLFIK